MIKATASSEAVSVSIKNGVFTRRRITNHHAKPATKSSRLTKHYRNTEGAPSFSSFAKGGSWASFSWKRMQKIGRGCHILTAPVESAIRQPRSKLLRRSVILVDINKTSQTETGRFRRVHAAASSCPVN